MISESVAGGRLKSAAAPKLQVIFGGGTVVHEAKPVQPMHQKRFQTSAVISCFQRSSSFVLHLAVSK